jgi:hypothetical protein
MHSEAQRSHTPVHGPHTRPYPAHTPPGSAYTPPAHAPHAACVRDALPSILATRPQAHQRDALPRTQHSHTHARPLTARAPLCPRIRMPHAEPLPSVGAALAVDHRLLYRSSANERPAPPPADSEAAARHRGERVQLYVTWVTARCRRVPLPARHTRAPPAHHLSGQRTPVGRGAPPPAATRDAPPSCRTARCFSCARSTDVVVVWPCVQVRFIGERGRARPRTDGGAATTRTRARRSSLRTPAPPVTIHGTRACT